MKKWTRRIGWTALLVMGGLLTLYFVGHKSVQAEIQVAATPETVWKVLADFPRTKEWNPVLVPIEGTLAEGNTIRYAFFQEPNGIPTEMKAEVLELKTGELIAQKGGMPGVLTFHHQYQLEKNPNGTLVKIKENYRGIMVPFWDPAPVELAYGRLLTSLRQRVIELNL